jgi:hypothetical protein
MFRGETAVELTTRLPAEGLYAKVEEALSDLGRARVDRRGGLTVGPTVMLGSSLTDVVVDGTVRPLGDGGYDVVVRYDCRPTTGCWVLAGALFVFTFFGALVVLVPLMDKKKVARRVEQALARLEDVADDRPG